MQKKYMGNFGGTSIIKDQSLLNHEAIKQQITILDELRDLIPPLQEEEINQLEKNILAEGCREALLIWQTTTNIVEPTSTESSALYILVDGHNRYGICLKHKLNFKIHLISFNSLKEVRDYMIDNQLGRRNLIPEQASYLRGLRYNTEKLSKGKYERIDHKGQNVPYGLSETNEDLALTHKGQNVPYELSETNEDLALTHKGQNVPYGLSETNEDLALTHKGQNVPYGSVAKKESTSARLSKQYNVSEKTIKRDAEFAEGLNLLTPDLKKDILSGKLKAKKSEIQQLAHLENSVELIDSLEKISTLLSNANSKDTVETPESVTFEYKNAESRDSLLKKVKKGLKNASDSDVTVEIKGAFIINNGLVDVWKKLRGFSDDIIIDESFTDRVSIFQAVNLGIVQAL
ncbi:hypothetical protein VB796_20590 [Arcicella sp. LKC2W]|uniref:hypothetical protein n=1 Tax=Arcicella sp. LKC2W TaxID=2984198 RepID=UPI002B21A093|nr:hypothetical protein [Arcicella sp. LKC2W]MEA5461476.1 hypothetical protein [Arcicella sp. LKC2W]